MDSYLFWQYMLLRSTPNFLLDLSPIIVYPSHKSRTNSCFIGLDWCDSGWWLKANWWSYKDNVDNLQQWLTREILGKTYVWGKLVEKIFPMNPQIQFLFNNDNSVGLKYGFDSRNRPRASFCKYWQLVHHCKAANTSIDFRFLDNYNEKNEFTNHHESQWYVDCWPLPALRNWFWSSACRKQKTQKSHPGWPLLRYFWASSLVPPKCLWPPLMGAASFDFKEKETELDHYRPNY